MKNIHTIPTDELSMSKEKIQETIEIAERLLKEHPDFEVEGMSEYQNGRFNGIIEGIEFQQKISYIEEEVKIMFDRYNEFISHHEPEEWQPWIDKQFKK